MDIIKLMNYLGYTSIHTDLDDFLSSNGVKKRPRCEEEEEEYIPLTKNESYAVFIDRDTFLESSLTAVLSEGHCVLHEVTISAKDNFALPFGLDFSLSISEVNNVLGDPIEVQNRLNHTATFFHEKLIIVVFIGDNKSIELIRFSLPNIYDKKNLGISLCQLPIN